jgi:hypothetical protein
MSQYCSPRTPGKDAMAREIIGNIGKRIGCPEEKEQHPISYASMATRLKIQLGLFVKSLANRFLGQDNFLSKSNFVKSAHVLEDTRIVSVDSFDAGTVLLFAKRSEATSILHAANEVGARQCSFES